MTRRGRKLVAGTAVAGLLVLAVIAVRPGAPGPVADTVASSAPEMREPIRITSSIRARAVVDEPAAPDYPTVDIARVEAALARLNATTARITAEELAEEQRRMLEAKARFEAVVIPEPEQRPFTDANGMRWIELRHASGELRYVLAPESDVALGAPGAVDGHGGE